MVIEKQVPPNFMQQPEIRQMNMPKAATERVPEARYAYYRQCQLFRRNGDQCKAPAEKGTAICHAHAAQQAMVLRRERERQAVLAEAVAEMRRQGRPEYEMADLFTDFKGIQVTLAVVSRALIGGRIDYKTAGRLLVHLQTMSKLLWMVHRKARKGNEESPQICADERRLKTVERLSEPAAVPLKVVPQVVLTSPIRRDIGGKDLRVAFETKILTFTQSRRGCRDGPCQEARAA
ncbi:MAG TPA: hypothetical protein VGQ12_18845 [Candidatus Angelobacter sp.]|nr:hypothetical protein [Candidatus Angelobacter sp.]